MESHGFRLVSKLVTYNDPERRRRGALSAVAELLVENLIPRQAWSCCLE